MNPRILGLLNRLREAIHEAIADSDTVAQTMAELEQEHCCPVFGVNVMLAEPPLPEQQETSDDALVLTEEDEHFLRAIKIAIAV